MAQFHDAASKLIHHPRAAAVFACELALCYYAFGSWRSPAHVPAGTRAVTHHLRSGQGGLVFGFILILAIEGFAVHLLINHWNPVLAWVFSLSTAYAALWMIGDYRATVLRPILITEDAVVVRAGLRYTLTIPLKCIAVVTTVKPAWGKEALSFNLLGDPSHWIGLTEPLIAKGPYGFNRRVRAVGIEPDQALDLEPLEKGISS